MHRGVFQNENMVKKGGSLPSARLWLSQCCSRGFYAKLAANSCIERVGHDSAAFPEIPSCNVEQSCTHAKRAGAEGLVTFRDLYNFPLLKYP